MKKKRNRRQKSKYPGLDPKVNRINLRDVIDFDYINSLTDAQKEWLSKFSVEYYSAGFDHTKTSYKNKTPIHKGKKARRKIYKRNNDRNFDMTSYLWNFRALASWEDEVKDNIKTKTNNPENALIEAIDMKKKKPNEKI